MAEPNLKTDLKQDWVTNEIVMPPDVNDWSERINNLNEVMPIYAATGNFYTATYSNNVYSLQPCTFTDNTQNVTPTSYIDGMSVCFKIPETNSGQCKVNVNNLGEKYIKFTNNTDISSNYFNVNEYITLKYNSDNDYFYVDTNNCSDKDLSNLTDTGEKHFVNYSQVTNCLLEIPQRIKLELKDDGKLYLLAGSVLTYANGTQITIQQDVSTEQNLTSSTYSNLITVYDTSLSTPSIQIYIQGTNAVSASSAPDTGAYQDYIWFDTTEMKMKITHNGGTSWSEIPLPIGLTSCTSTSWVSIDQVFNGIGYIGKTVWVDKGVKGVRPNGRNEDGTMKNVIFEYDKLVVRSDFVLTFEDAGGVIGLNPSPELEVYFNIGRIGANNFIYNQEENFNYNISSSITQQWHWAAVGIFTIANSNITSLKLNNTLNLATYADLANLQADVPNTYVKKSGDTMTGTLHSSMTAAKKHSGMNLLISDKTSSYLTSTRSRTDYFDLISITTPDLLNSFFMRLESNFYTNGDHAMLFSVRKNGSDATFSTLGLGYKVDGTPYTIAPTPSGNDSSTKIATTAFVRDCFRSSRSNFMTFSKSTNGYLKLANGIIFQWGNFTIGASSQWISFPISFSNANYGLASIKDKHNRDTTNAVNYLVGSCTASGFSTVIRTGSGNAVDNGTLKWIAIGY